METVTYQGKPIHKWTVGPSTFTASITQGARLMHWDMALGDGMHRSLLYWPEDADLKKIAKVRGGNPILFPFAGASYEDGENGYWKDERGLRRTLPQHGFARQGSFTLKDLHHAGFSAVFAPDEEAKNGYPYQYEFTVTYRFERLGFGVDLVLRNLDREPIPWAAGHHFYFNLPWSEHLRRKDYGLTLPHRKAYRQNPENGELEPLQSLGKKVSLGEPELFNRIHTQLKSPEIRVQEEGDEAYLRIETNAEKKFLSKMAVLTWAESPESPYYCVEPWMTPPNQWNQPEAMHYVEPGKSQTFFTEVRLVTPE